MDENIWSTTVWLDKAEPLLAVEKFHCSSGHCLSFAVPVAIFFGTNTNALIAGEGQVARCAMSHSSCTVRLEASSTLQRKSWQSGAMAKTKVQSQGFKTP